MMFTIYCQDRPGALATRLEVRPVHLAYLDSHAASIALAGPVLDAEGNPNGSLIVADVADRAAAEALAAGDPYAQAGVFESATIRPFRQVFKDGQR
jgi:uncharacterized protein YciI